MAVGHMTPSGLQDLPGMKCPGLSRGYRPSRHLRCHTSSWQAQTCFDSIRIFSLYNLSTLLYVPPSRRSQMNKLELISMLKEEAKLSKAEAAKIVEVFLREWQTRWPMGNGWKSGGCVRSMSRNIRAMSVGTPRPVSR